MVMLNRWQISASEMSKILDDVPISFDISNSLFYLCQILEASLQQLWLEGVHVALLAALSKLMYQMDWFT